MRRIVLCLGMLLAWPMAGQAAKLAEPTSVEFGAGAWVDVDATGKAHVVEMDRLSEFKDEDKPGSLADIIKSRLRERIETWEFTPPTQAGATVPGKTHIYVSLEALSSDGGGMAIRVESATTGAKLANRQMGGLIETMMDYGYAGRVTVDVAWKNDGTVETANSIDPPIDGKATTQSIPPKVLKAVLKVARTWRFDPEIVAGTAIPGHGTVPIAFCWDGKCPADERSETKTPEPQFTALSPAVNLRTAVVGTVL